MARTRTLLRFGFACFMTGAGLSHFTSPQTFIDIMPSSLAPWALELVYISGIAELLGGLGLLVPRTRRLAGNGLVLLLIAVFPANLNMAINNLPFGDQTPSPALLWGRLPLQLVLIFLAYWLSRPAPSSQPTAVDPQTTEPAG